jgi:hypothetical protein
MRSASLAVLSTLVVASLVLSIFVVLYSPLCPAQDATGRVLGTVYDPQGAVVPAAQITVTNTATQVIRKATTAGPAHRKLPGDGETRRLSHCDQRRAAAAD